MRHGDSEVTNRHVLVVEDEPRIASVLRDYLERAGFTVSWLDRGDAVTDFLGRESPGLVLLDLMLPGADGMDLCREIRKASQIPVIMVTARVEEADRLVGLELGADDYVCKPFSPREVVARVKAVLRRTQPPPEERKLAVGEISLDLHLHRAVAGSVELQLTPSEFELLRTFLGHPNRVFSRGELVQKVLGYDYEGYDRTIDTHIKNLRKKIGLGLPGREAISTVYGVGYKLSFPME